MPDQEAEPENGGQPRDLLSVALLVFFVALLAIVAALTVLPLLLG